LLLKGTQIAIDATAFKPIECFQVGDPVSTAGLSLGWTEEFVQFSNGTGDAGPSSAIQLHAGNDSELIGSPEQYVLTSRGLVPMKDISPGDTLIQADGQDAEVLAATMEMLDLGMWSIATSQEFAVSIDKHLLVANGFVVADYALCLALQAGMLPTTISSAGQIA